MGYIRRFVWAPRWLQVQRHRFRLLQVMSQIRRPCFHTVYDVNIVCKWCCSIEDFNHTVVAPHALFVFYRKQNNTFRKNDNKNTNIHFKTAQICIEFKLPYYIQNENEHTYTISSRNAHIIHVNKINSTVNTGEISYGLYRYKYSSYITLNIAVTL